MNYDFNEQRIAQQLAARSLSGLFEMLLNLRGLTLNQKYSIRWLYAVGGQSILFLVDSPDGQTAIAKLALLPYHRAAYISTEDIHKARRRLVSEANLLKRFQGTVLPNFYDLIYTTNPLLSSARGEEVVSQEPILVMEFVPGQTLLQTIHTIYHTRELPRDAIEWIAWQVAVAASDFFISISEGENPYLYSDFNPLNIILTDDLQKPVRILDAGSLIPFNATTTLLPPFSWAYIPPEYYEAYDKGKYLWPTPNYVMYTLGKVLWQLLTNRRPSPAEDPDLSEPTINHYAQSLQDLIFNLVKRKYISFNQLEQEITSGFTPKQAPGLSLKDILDTTSEPSEPSMQGSRSTKTTLETRPTSPSRVVKLTKVSSTQIDAGGRLRYSPKGQYIVVTSRNKVELRNARDLSLVRRFKSPHSAPIISLDFDSTGKYLASGSREEVTGTVSLWHIDAENPIWQHQIPGCNGQVALDAQANLLAAATKWRVVTFHPQRAIETGHEFEGIADKDISLAVGKQQPLLAVGGFGGIRLWNHMTQSELGLLSVDFGTFVEQINFSNNDQTIAALISDAQDSIMIWDLPSRKLLWQIEIPFSHVTDTSLVSKGELVAATSSNGYLWIWDWKRKVEYARLTDCGRASSVDFAPLGQNLAVVTIDGQICIYHLDK